MKALLIRAFLYLVLVALVSQALYYEATSLDHFSMFSEWGHTEPLQSLTLFLCGALLLIKGRMSPRNRELAVCLALLFLAMLVRENDQHFEMMFPHGFWKFPAGLALLVMGIYAWHYRARLSEQVGRFTRSMPFGLMTSGFLALVFSRLVGRTAHWQAILGDAYIRAAKNAVEEGVEFFALALLLIGVIEWMARRYE
ncbi:MAG: hypothetical protein HKN58_09235 [Xanthomonadales bacterium]|nr:hypothetical protein [Xanthomonadales bacterium]